MVRCINYRQSKHTSKSPPCIINFRELDIFTYKSIVSIVWMHQTSKGRTARGRPSKPQLIPSNKHCPPKPYTNRLLYAYIISTSIQTIRGKKLAEFTRFRAVRFHVLGIGLALAALRPGTAESILVLAFSASSWRIDVIKVTSDK